MGDYLEKLVRDHRSTFDSESPSDGVWSAINEGLEKEHRPRWKYGLWKYAAILFLVSTVALLVDRTGGDKPQSVAELSELEQVERYYTQLIEDKRQQLAMYESAALEESFENDLHQLDDLYKELKDQFENDIMDQKVRDAMIMNLKIRLDILSRQIEILERINDDEYGDEETDLI